jgi:hypothetical protein
MLRNSEANDRLNVRIHPVIKARMIAECERISKQLRRTYGLADLVSDWGKTLGTLPVEIERAIEERYEPRKEVRSAKNLKPRSLARSSA